MDHDFDERAATWDDDPGKIERANRVADAIRRAVPLDPSMRVLEFGAGTGLLTQALRDDVGPVTLTDISAGMRQVMEDKVAAGALPDARVWDIDLAEGPLPDERFDLVVSLMALHHIPDTDAVIASVATLLDPGGRICIVDLDAEDGSFHGHDSPVHKGFGRTALAAQLEAAGFTDVSIDDCHSVQRENGTFPLFLAVATAPAG
ncbi:MAG: class I SAM-dependent methyltransferase [Acidimicrobiia bacterium]|nr:class I SAM-dependent methyltransferase [Acidimicrobiia bacterium]